jgi:signal transduction histidine kinase
LKLQTKLVGAFGMTALVTLAVAAVGYLEADRLASGLYEVGTVRLPSIQGLDDIAEGLEAMHSCERTLLLANLGPEQVTEQQTLRHAAADRSRAGWRLYEPLPQTPAESIAWQTFVASWRVWREEHEGIVALAVQAHASNDGTLLEVARARSLDATSQRFVTAKRDLATVRTINDTIADEARRRSIVSLSDAVRVRRVVLITAVVGVAGALLIGFLIGRRLSRPIAETADAIARIAQGDLSSTVAVQSGDEIGSMAQAVNTLAASLKSNDAERRMAEEALRQANERYVRHEAALTTLTRNAATRPGDLSRAFALVTETVATSLNTTRCGIWRIEGGGGRLVSQDIFVRATGEHDSGHTIEASAYPTFFTSVATANVFASSDMFADPTDAGFADGFMKPYGLRALMFAQLHAHGLRVGALACSDENRREWTRDEQSFLVAVANLVSALLAHVERQRLEEQLRQSQKMEAIGLLAGGVAHDFNNILTVILGRAALLGEDDRLPADLREAVADIEQTGERAARLTRQLLAFSRRQAMDARDIDLNEVVASVGRMLRRVLGEDVSAQFVYFPTPVMVHADPGMLDQVLLNLAVNARDAMPNGGHLTIETALVDGTGDFVVPGRCACVSVSDTGCGISTEDMQRIFDPFFTTKEMGKGSGLGLATSYGIVQQHGGSIKVESERGRGTTFTILLPTCTVTETSLAG